MKFVNALFFNFLFFLSLFSYSQEPILEGYMPIDSLVDKDYKTFIDHFNRTASGLGVELDSVFAHEVAMTYLWKAYQINDSLNIGKAYTMLSKLEGLRLDYLDKAILYTRNLNNKSEPALSFILKSDKFYNEGNYKKSIELLFVALEYTKKNENKYLSFYIEKNINILRSYWGDKNEAIKEYNKNFSLINLVDFDSTKYREFSVKGREIQYVDNQYDLAHTYYQNKEFENASIYLDSVYSYGVKNNIREYKNHYLGLIGSILYRKGSFENALKHTNEYLEFNESDDHYGNSRSLNMKGLILWKLNHKEEAIQNIQKADSLYQITDDEFEELGEGYQLLINHYKDTGDTENQLLYLNKLIDFDRKISSNYIEIGNRIAQEYTLPQLLAEKDSVISKLNAQKNAEKRTKYIVFILLGFFGFAILYYVRQQYRSKKKFHLLQQEFEKASISSVNSEIVISKKPTTLDLDEKQLATITEGLEDFEKSQGFLDGTVTLKSLAETLETNSSYLSKYVNGVKETNFSTYISDLRIQYAIYKLQEDVKFRSYTIEAIASEVGFSNTRSFTNHFKRVTGITVSYFMKKLPTS